MIATALLLLGLSSAQAGVTVTVTPAGTYVSVNPWSPSWVPAPRSGYAWVGGHYDAWGNWVPGHWHPPTPALVTFGSPATGLEPAMWKAIGVRPHIPVKAGLQAIILVDTGLRVTGVLRITLDTVG